MCYSKMHFGVTKRDKNYKASSNYIFKEANSEIFYLALCLVVFTFRLDEKRLHEL